MTRDIMHTWRDLDRSYEENPMGFTRSLLFSKLSVFLLENHYYEATRRQKMDKEQNLDKKIISSECQKTIQRVRQITGKTPAEKQSRNYHNLTAKIKEDAIFYHHNPTKLDALRTSQQKTATTAAAKQKGNQNNNRQTNSGNRQGNRPNNKRRANNNPKKVKTIISG